MIEKWPRDLNRQFTEAIQMANKYVKRYVNLISNYGNAK